MRNKSTYHAEDREIMQGLASARRAINHTLRSELDEAERKRRVAEYTCQVEQHGSIVDWMPPSREVCTRYTSRFDRLGVLAERHPEYAV